MLVQTPLPEHCLQFAVTFNLTCTVGVG